MGIFFRKNFLASFLNIGMPPLGHGERRYGWFIDLIFSIRSHIYYIVKKEVFEGPDYRKQIFCNEFIVLADIWALRLRTHGV